MFQPDSEIAHIANHISWLFHATIGLDPLGNFSSIDTLAYEVPVFEYNEMGRNHAPVRLPFREPGQPGEVTLRWGMIVRSKLFEWIHDVEVGRDFQKHVYIFQLSRKHLPLRVYHLTGAWPSSWKTSEFSTEDKTALATEEVTLVYDQISMTNLSAVAMLGELADEPLSDLVDSMHPKSLAPRSPGLSGGKERWLGYADARSFTDIWTDPQIVKDLRAREWQELQTKWAKYRAQSAETSALTEEELAWEITEVADDQAKDARQELEEFVATGRTDEQAKDAKVEVDWKPSESGGNAGDAGLPPSDDEGGEE